MKKLVATILIVSMIFTNNSFYLFAENSAFLSLSEVRTTNYSESIESEKDTKEDEESSSVFVSVENDEISSEIEDTIVEGGDNEEKDDTIVEAEAEEGADV